MSYVILKLIELTVLVAGLAAVYGVYRAADAYEKHVELRSKGNAKE